MKRLGRHSYSTDVAHLAPHMQDPFIETGLLSGLLLPNRYGGGRLRWAFDGQGPQNHGAGYLTAWTETHLADADYAATSVGAPYVTLDGTNDYLTITDPAWGEMGAEECLVWCWCYVTDLTATRVALAKDTGAAGGREWSLVYNLGATDFRFQVSGDGTAMTVVDTSLTEAINTWYFIVGYYQPSTLLRIYVGDADDATLTIDSNTTSIPASVATAGTPNLTIGAFSGGGSPWPGRMAAAAMRANVPAANIDSMVDRVFQLTRRFYV